MPTMGKEWAEARRATRVEALRARLPGALGGAGDLTLEIGCGHGHWLVAYGAAHPDERCVGIDLLGERLAKCEAKRARRGLGNVRFLKAEAGELLDALPADVRLTRVFLLYPDPWPKRRQNRKRFLQAANLDRLARACPPGARLAFRTDHADYHAAAGEALAAHPDWRVLPGAPWPFEAPTFFQDLLRDKRDWVAERR